MDRLLPPVKFVEPPAPEKGRELARELIEKVAPQLGGLVIAKMVIDQQGWKMGYAPFSETSTIQSLLIPLLQGDFAITLNPCLLPEDPEARIRQEAFLTGHEIAHSLFYSGLSDQPPHRIAGKYASVGEEAFCDEFGRPFSEW